MHNYSMALGLVPRVEVKNCSFILYSCDFHVYLEANSESYPSKHGLQLLWLNISYVTLCYLDS
jgi:hypothetical protein